MVTHGSVPVTEAARQLGVRRSRVHALVRAGVLDADRAGSQLLVDPTSLRRRLTAALPVGRPFAPRQAWALLALASDEPELIERCLRDLSPSSASRLRGRLRRESIAASAPRLRARARTVRLRADPADLAEIASDLAIVRTGVSAANEHCFDVVAPGVLEAYVAADGIQRLVDSYFLEPTTRPNAILHLVPDPWPFPPGRRVAPYVVAALDLAAADDERTRRAGRDALERLATASASSAPLHEGKKPRAKSSHRASSAR